MKTSAEPFKDKRNAHRIRVTAEENSHILYSSTQGYSHLKDAIKAAVRSAKAILEKYDQIDLEDDVHGN